MSDNVYPVRQGLTASVASVKDGPMATFYGLDEEDRPFYLCLNPARLEDFLSRCRSAKRAFQARRRKEERWNAKVRASIEVQRQEARPHDRQD